jgi:hypothetical protein
MENIQNKIKVSPGTHQVALCFKAERADEGERGCC